MKVTSIQKTFFRFLNHFFDRLYHQLAFSYDIVANLVSLGRWQQWIFQIIPFIQGKHILEIGFGPGHLFNRMITESVGKIYIGIDESRQMIELTKRRLTRNNHTGSHQVTGTLVRGMSQSLPFQSSFFDTIISTFPASYIFDMQTIREIHRSLKPGGICVILFSVQITGKGLIHRFIKFLFTITNESPSPSIVEALIERYQVVGFQTTSKDIILSHEKLNALICTKKCL